MQLHLGHTSGFPPRNHKLSVDRVHTSKSFIHCPPWFVDLCQPCLNCCVLGSPLCWFIPPYSQTSLTLKFVLHPTGLTKVPLFDWKWHHSSQELLLIITHMQWSLLPTGRAGINILELRWSAECRHVVECEGRLFFYFVVLRSRFCAKGKVGWALQQAALKKNSDKFYKLLLYGELVMHRCWKNGWN